MRDGLFAFFDIGLVFAIALSLAIWQLIDVKRRIRRDREKATLAGRLEADP